ncbi:MAG: DNA polymerase III subunit gamma/tau [Actinomycetota bacterium]|nr:DNA polymerase III subunit gamma/tau [Actinomycetota bacterium]
MASVSLYRTHRPQTFAEVIGQEHVTTTLAHAVDEGRPHHAYLFTGPRGTGKTSAARILAKALNCEQGPTATPCNECGQCRSVTQGSNVDVIEIDAASHGGVDDVRDLRDRVAFAPAAARTKVYVVDECHMLSTAGWNAFLKTVEEPPGHVVFVFATTEPHKVLETILSRTQRFDFKRIAAPALVAHLAGIAEREGLELESGAADLVAQAADGSVRDALSVLDQVVAFSGPRVTLAAVAEVLGAVPDELMAEAADAIAAGDAAALCVLVQRLSDAGHDPRRFAQATVERLRALLLLKTAPDADLVETTPERLTRLRSQAGRLGRLELVRAMDLLAEAQAAMRRGNTRLPLELALVKAALPESAGDPAALGARLDRLERRIGVDPAPVGTDPPERVDSLPESDSQSTHSGVVGVDLGLVHDSWPAVLEATKRRTRRLHAFLGEARAVSLEEGTLTLEFRSGYGFHADHCASEASRRVLRDVFGEVLGETLDVRCRVADGGDLPPPVAEASNEPAAHEVEAVLETEAAEAAGDLPDEATAHDQAVRTLTRDLGATVVDDSTAG